MKIGVHEPKHILMAYIGHAKTGDEMQQRVKGQIRILGSCDED